MRAPNGVAKGASQWREVSAKRKTHNKQRRGLMRHDKLRGFYKRQPPGPCVTVL